MLFIDEAYTLAAMTQSDFGPEAVLVLLKRMEDQRGQFVVVVAGYPEEMEQIISPILNGEADLVMGSRMEGLSQ